MEFKEWPVKKPIREKVEEETVYEKNIGGEVVTDKRMDNITNETNKFSEINLPPEKDVNFEMTPDGQKREGYRTKKELKALRKQKAKYEIKDRGL